MKEILDLAQKLGTAIAESEEVKTFHEMEKIYYEDEAAQKAMQDYEDTRARMTVKAKETGMTPAFFRQQLNQGMF